MLIYIRGVIYNASKEDIGILLSDSDKRNITNMSPDCDCYLSGPKLTEEKAGVMSTKLKQRGKSNDQINNRKTTSF